jgi:hypothetical protein
MALAAVLILGIPGIGKATAGSPESPAVAPRDTGTVFTVPQFGRYAVKVSSTRGAGLQLIDHMAGPGTVDGAPGERDGRIDLFLGPGDHKARITAAAREPGTPELAVLPFRELNPGTPPQLVELALVQTELEDLQQRSYWLDIRSRQTVFLEAAGRHLGDLRLWKDGTWLVDAVPTRASSERRPGQPLAVRQLVADLEPGLYLLTAYGGVGETWSTAGTDHPLALRWGIPQLPETGRRQFVAGPFGFDRWLVPGMASAFRLEVPRGESGNLDVATYDNGIISDTLGAAIDKTTRSSSVDVDIDPLRNGTHSVTIRRAAGEPYVLQQYVALGHDLLTVPADAAYLVGTLRPGHDEDAADLTAVLTEITSGTGAVEEREKIIARQTIGLGPASPWRRRFNLTDPVSLYVDIARPGRYRVATTGVQPEVDWQPMSLPGSTDRRTAPQASDGVWDLDAGLYVLRLTPGDDGRGILGLSLYADGSPEAAEPSAPLPGASFGPVTLQRIARYRLRLSETGENLGVVIRKLPAALADDLPLVLAAGERRSFAVSLPAAGTVRALTDGNDALPVSLDGAPAADTVKGAAGGHTVEVTNATPAPAIAALHFQADAPAAPVTLPPMAAESLGTLPDFPVLEAGKPRFLDLEKRQTATYTVKVDAPALYRLETTGLLQTTGTLRTQVLPSLARASANGVGRNVLLQHYLSEGLYQFTVGTEGATAGHLGVTLTAALMRDGGALTPGLPAHASLAEGEGVIYSFEVAEAGPYRLRVLAPTGATTIRLEDAEGWPLTPPDQPGDLRRDLAPGHYRLVALPHPLPGRLLTLVEREQTAPAPAGHGPHPLPLDGTAANRWEEPTDGGPRRPDVWTFGLPAEADLSITLTEPMQGEIRRDGEDAVVAALSFRQPWQGRLAAGSYHLDVKTVRPDNRVDYTVTTAVTQLTAGNSRTVTAPADIPVAVAGDRRIEISSFGTGEVRATLLDAAGTVVARSDQRPDDWNFTLSARLAPGQYDLKVDPVAGTPVATTVSLRPLAGGVDAPLAAPDQRTFTDGLSHVLPLAFKPGDGPLLVAAARSADPVGLALERRAADGVWRAVGSTIGPTAILALPRDAAIPADYRLQVWSVNQTRRPITLALRAMAPPPVSEQALAAGIAPVAVPGLEPPLGVAAVTLDQPGLFRLTPPPPPGLIWSTAAGERVLANGPDLVVAGGTTLWFLQNPAGGRIQARRVGPEAGVPLSLTLPDAASVTVPVPSGGHGPRLWVANSRIGQPGLTVGPRHGLPDGRGSGLANGVAVAVLPEAAAGGAPVIGLRRADGSGELPLILRRFDFAPPTPVALDWGESDRTLEAGAAAALSLPAGPKRLRLALPAHLAAALLNKDGAVERLVWSEGPGTAESLDSTAERLLLLNADPAAGALSLLVTPALEGAGGLKVSSGVLLRQSLPTAGSLRVEIALTEAERGQGLALRLSGPVEEALLLQRDGTVRRGGLTLTVDDAAVLVLRHGPGALAAWLGNGDEQDWLAATRNASPQALPATLIVSGTETAWRFKTPEPALLHLASAMPVLAGVLRSGGTPDLTVWPQGANLHLFLPAGDEGAVIGLRPLQQGALSGSVRVVRSATIPIGEGIGPKVRLAPGDARLFGFVLTEARPVGVGVRGQADSARVRLLDQTGRTLAEGTIAMSELAAGRYFLQVENRSDATTTDVQPVLVGATAPDRSPPEDVKRQYWDLVTEPEDGPHHEN